MNAFLRVRRSGRNIVLLSTALALAAIFSACSKSDEGAESGNDAITGTKCQIVNVKAGRPMTTEELSKLDDPIAAFALAGADCPRSFAEITAKLKKTDTAGCGGGSTSGGGDSGAGSSGGSGEGGPSVVPPPPRANVTGISTRFVSETSQVWLSPTP